LISAAASILAELIIPLVSLVLEVSIFVLLASIRPWRYLISSAFRGEIDARYVGRNQVIKLWHLLWGSVLLMASIAVVVGVTWAWLHMRTETQPPRSLRQLGVEKAEQVIMENVRRHQNKQN